MKTIFISFVFALCTFVLQGQPYTVNLQLQESIQGGCGFHTNCVTHTVCYDLIATPSVNGAWVASYDIWYVINGGSGTNVVYSSDGTCIIVNNTDLPASGATTFIRVGASQGTAANLIIGPTLIHNFCMTYTTLGALNGSTLTAGGIFGGFNSNMSVNVNNVPTNAVIVPTTLTISNLNTSCDPLPVKWLSFEVTKSGQTAQLDWSTAQDLNNEGFIIENSLDGEHFEKIAEVGASSDPGPVNHYVYNDIHPFNGRNYYRIKQFDYDGQFGYSPIRTVVFSQRSFDARVWPNPANTFLNVQMQLDQNETAVVTLLNSAGQVVMRQKMEAGVPEALLDVSNVGPGLYNVLIETASATHIEKIAIVR